MHKVKMSVLIILLFVDYSPSFDPEQQDNQYARPLNNKTIMNAPFYDHLKFEINNIR